MDCVAVCLAGRIFRLPRSTSVASVTIFAVCLHVCGLSQDLLARKPHPQYHLVCSRGEKICLNQFSPTLIYPCLVSEVSHTHLVLRLSLVALPESSPERLESVDIVCIRAAR